jgi:dTDP-glucose 4,6-dehydratase
VKRVLVTGAAGFIGSNFVRFLLKKDPDVRILGLDILTYAGDRMNVEDLDPARFRLYERDIREKEWIAPVMISEEIDTIVHFAAESHVDRSILGPEAFIQTNVIGTFRLLEAAREAWAKKKEDPSAVRFHHVSTDEVYGSLRSFDPPFTEKTPYDPSSPYSASKAAADHLVRAYGRTYGIPFTISNCSNNYGPYQHPEKLIPLVVLNALEGKRIPVYGDGKQRRDWLYVEDHCEAILAILEKGKPGETYNIGGDNELDNIEIVRAILGELDCLQPLPEGGTRETLIEHVPDRPGHDRRYAVSFGKLWRETNWLPRRTFQDGLSETIQWYISNRMWVRKIKEKGFAEWSRENYEKRGAR